MDSSKRIKDFVKECKSSFVQSDGTLREGQLMYNNALQRFPTLEFHKITHTVSDPFYIDDNIDMFIEFLKQETDGK